MGKLVALIVLLLVAAAGLIVAGIHLLVGPAWAMIAAGLLLVNAALVLRKGLTNG